MRVFIGILLSSLALVAVGCGDEGSTTSAESKLDAAAQEYLEVTDRIEVPEGPPPKKVVIKDLKVGSGEVARRGDQVTIHYVAVAYRTGLTVTYRWGEADPATYPRLRYGRYAGLEQGIEGMREGGRRKLIIPSHLAFNLGALVYLVQLEDVEPAAPSGG